jgi:hypothetical protein
VRCFGDLLKFKDTKQIDQILCRRKKWACEVSIEIQKSKTQKTKDPFEMNINKKDKINCLKNSYSHKILRYLLLKYLDDDVHKLNQKLAYLDRRNVKEAIRIVKD